MLKIGITGNIGSGKTTVSKIFEVLGVPVFYADDAAKRVMTTDPELISEIRSAFGEASYFEDGSLNRKHIAAIVFNDDASLKKLNAFVHPATFRAFDAWLLRIKNEPYVLKEAALLFESDAHKRCDYTVLVQAPTETRIARVMKRDNLTRAEIVSRDAHQYPQEKKKELADFIIRNDETELVVPQVLELHKHLLSLSQNGAS